MADEAFLCFFKKKFDRKNKSRTYMEKFYLFRKEDECGLLWVNEREAQDWHALK